MPEVANRLIVHADMDAFFASVEILDNPALRTLPVVVGGQSARGVVAAASYRARDYGIRSAMSMVEARKRCPSLIICPPRFERYKTLSRIVMQTLACFSESLEPLSIDEAFLDVSAHPYTISDDLIALGREIKRSVFDATSGLTVSVGLAPNKFIAKIASDVNKPNGLTVVRQEEALAFLNPLPVSKLWGAGPKTTERLNALGIKTIGDVRQAPEIVLQNFGRMGRQFIEFAQGRDDRPVSGRGPRKSIGIERTLEVDLWLNEDCYEWVLDACKHLSARLRESNLNCTGLRLKLKRTNHQTLSRQMTLGAPSADVNDLFGAAKHLLVPLIGSMKVRLIGLSVFNLVSPPSQLKLPF